MTVTFTQIVHFGTASKWCGHIIRVRAVKSIRWSCGELVIRYADGTQQWQALDMPEWTIEFMTRHDEIGYVTELRKFELLAASSDFERADHEAMDRAMVWYMNAFDKPPREFIQFWETYLALKRLRKRR
jgi:hypothetical protein